MKAVCDATKNVGAVVKWREKTAENSVQHRGGGSMVANHRGGGESSMS